MARPKPRHPAALSILALADEEGRLAIRVTPGARSEVLEIADGSLFAKVRAKPEDGKANDAVRGLLSQALGIAPSHLELLRGTTSREKLFRIGSRPA